jgi:hypothetical protein
MDHNDKISYLIQHNKKINQEIDNRKERKKEYNKKYYERLHGSKPKDDSIECHICGGYWKPDNKWRHLNTKKHMRAYSKYIYENVKK